MFMYSTKEKMGKYRNEVTFDRSDILLHALSLDTVETVVLVEECGEYCGVHAATTMANIETSENESRHCDTARPHTGHGHEEI